MTREAERDALTLPVRCALILRRAGRIGDAELLAVCKASADTMREVGLEPMTEKTDARPSGEAA